MSMRSLFVLALSVFGVLAVSAVQAQDSRYGGRPGYGGGPNTVDCRSSGYSYQRCDVPWRDAQIVRQLSGTQCRRGQNWGFDRRGFVWVDRGCAGRFVAAGGGGYGGGWQPGPGWNQRFTVRCDSNNGQNNYCQVDVGGRGRVYLQRQESSSPCVEGQTWGWNRGGVWVAQGCRGTFSIDRRW